jgi:uncharacterized integral membrane protein
MPNDPDPAIDAPVVDAPAAPPAAGTAVPVAPQSPGRRRSISRAAWLALVVGVVVLIFMLIFILQNNVATAFTFLSWTFSVPLGVAVLFAAIAGALITAMVGTVRMIVLGRSVRRLEKQRATLI